MYGEEKGKEKIEEEGKNERTQKRKKEMRIIQVEIITKSKKSNGEK